MFVKAWFIPDENVRDPWERFKLLRVDEQQTEIPYVPEKVTEFLSYIIKQCFEEHLQGNPTKLTVEVFLPRMLLWDEVEKWEYRDSEELFTRIGIRYRVVVRSYERLKKLRTEQGAKWKENWLKVQQLWTHCLCEKEFMPLAQNSFDPTQLRDHLLEKIALKVSCTLSELNMDGLLRAIHSAGIPIVILSRREVPKLKNNIEFDKLLEGGPLHELPERLKGQRYAAEQDGDEMHLGKHLVLLWDDPNRILPDFELESFA